MRLPLVVVAGVTAAERQRFHRHIDSDESGWHRRFTESIWRRHQHPSNAARSGYRGAGDARRRLLHFYDEYDLLGDDFVLKNAYLSLQLSLPEPELEGYRAAVGDGLRRGGWQAAGADHGWDGADEQRHALWRRGDLEARVCGGRVHPEEARRGLAAPAGYAYLGLSLRSRGFALPPGFSSRPWQVFFEVGLRRVLPAGQPRMVEPEALRELLPAQVELGCGPSIEAGIPHLSTLHRIYGVSGGDYGFVFRAEHDGLLRVLADPEAKYREMTAIHGACLRAGPTPFYRGLQALHRRGLLVGPIITNNFDCQCADLGLPEISLRRYDWGPYYPRIDYHPAARALLVVGVHADRRLVQMRARERGLPVLYIDPEEYVAPDGARIAYPVEAPQTGDLFVRSPASEAMTRLEAATGNRG